MPQEEHSHRSIFFVLLFASLGEPGEAFGLKVGDRQIDELLKDLFGEMKKKPHERDIADYVVTGVLRWNDQMVVICHHRDIAAQARLRDHEPFFYCCLFDSLTEAGIACGIKVGRQSLETVEKNFPHALANRHGVDLQFYEPTNRICDKPNRREVVVFHNANVAPDVK